MLRLDETSGDLRRDEPDLVLALSQQLRAVCHEHSALRRLLDDTADDVGADDGLSGSGRQHQQQGSMTVRPVAKHFVDCLTLIVAVWPQQTREVS
jgi:hypothetical protein